MMIFYILPHFFRVTRVKYLMEKLKLLFLSSLFINYVKSFMMDVLLKEK